MKVKSKKRCSDGPAIGWISSDRGVELCIDKEVLENQDDEDRTVKFLFETPSDLAEFMDRADLIARGKWPPRPKHEWTRRRRR